MSPRASAKVSFDIAHERFARQYHGEPPPEFPLTLFPSQAWFTICQWCRCKETQHTTDTDTETHTQRQTQTHAETHTQRQNRKHVYSRRWSWPCFHRGGSSDPASRRHARHCGTRSATSVLVSPQDVFGGTQTSTLSLSLPPLLPLSRSFSSSSPCSRLTFSQSRFWKCTKLVCNRIGN